MAQEKGALLSLDDETGVRDLEANSTPMTEAREAVYSNVRAEQEMTEERSRKEEEISVRRIIDVEKEEEEKKKKMEADTVVLMTDEEIDKMIEDAQISSEERIKLRDSIRLRRAAFTKDLRPAGQAYFEPHRIKLRTEEPLYTPQHRRSEVKDEIIDKEALELYKKGVIRRAWTSAYNSPMMVVKKKDGRWRSVIDYRRINSLTIKEPYPIPRADEAFDALSKAGLMTTFDLTWDIGRHH